MKEFSTGGTTVEVTPNMSILHLDRKAFSEYTVLPRQVFLHCAPVPLYRCKVANLQQKISFATGTKIVNCCIHATCMVTTLCSLHAEISHFLPAKVFQVEIVFVQVNFIPFFL